MVSLYKRRFMALIKSAEKVLSASMVVVFSGDRRSCSIGPREFGPLGCDGRRSLRKQPISAPLTRAAVNGQNTMVSTFQSPTQVAGSVFLAASFPHSSHGLVHFHHCGPYASLRRHGEKDIDQLSFP
jgi:hypothetical protein